MTDHKQEAINIIADEVEIRQALIVMFALGVIVVTILEFIGDLVTTLTGWGW